MRKALEMMEKSGMSKAEARATLKEDEEALLQEADFIEAKKKIYSKK